MSSIEQRLQRLERMVEELRFLLVKAKAEQPTLAEAEWLYATDIYDTGSSSLPADAPRDSDFGLASSLVKGWTAGPRLALTTWVKCPAVNVVGFRARMKIRNDGQALRLAFMLSSSAQLGVNGRYAVRVNSVAQTDGHITLPQGVAMVGVYAFLLGAPGHTLQLGVQVPPSALLVPQEIGLE